MSCAMLYSSEVFSMFNGTLYAKVVVRSTHCIMLPSVSHIGSNKVDYRIN